MCCDPKPPYIYKSPNIHLPSINLIEYYVDKYLATEKLLYMYLTRHISFDITLEPDAILIIFDVTLFLPKYLYSI